MLRQGQLQQLDLGRPHPAQLHLPAVRDTVDEAHPRLCQSGGKEIPKLDQAKDTTGDTSTGVILKQATSALQASEDSFRDSGPGLGHLGRDLEGETRRGWHQPFTQGQ